MLSFIYNSKLVKTCLLFLQLAIFVPVLGATQTPVQAQAPAQSQEPQAQAQEMPSFDQLLSPEMFSGLGQDMEKEQARELEIKQANFENLPQHIKDAYNAANQKYVTFLKHIDIKNGLKDLCDKIRKKLDSLAEKNQNPECSSHVKVVKEGLDKFEEALFAGAFKQIPAIPKTAQKNFLAELIERMKAGANPKTNAKDGATGELAGLADFQLNFDEKDKKNEESELKCKFIEKDFIDLFDSFGQILQDIKEAEDAELLSDILSFRNIVITVQQDNQPELVKRYLKLVFPLQKEASRGLRGLKKLLNQELIPLKKARIENFELGENDPKVLAQVYLYSYWIEDVTKSIDNIRKFESLKSSVNSVLGQSGWLFDKAGFIYDLVRPIYSFWLKEKLEKHTTWGGFEQWWCEFGVDVAFTWWMRTIQDFNKSKPQLDAHVLNGEQLGKPASPMDMIGKMLSSISSGGVDPMVMMESMVLGMMGGSGLQARFMKAGLFFFNAVNVTNTPRGLSRSLINLFGNYPRIAALSLDLKGLATEYVWQFGREYCRSGQLSAYPSYDMRNDIRIYGKDKVAGITNWTTNAIDQLLPSFWTHCDRFTAGIVNPGIFSSLTPKIFDLWIRSSGFMDRDPGFNNEKLTEWKNDIAGDNEDKLPRTKRQRAVYYLEKYLDHEYYSTLFAKAAEGNVEAIANIKALPFYADKNDGILRRTLVAVGVRSAVNHEKIKTDSEQDAGLLKNLVENPKNKTATIKDLDKDHPLRQAFDDEADVAKIRTKAANLLKEKFDDTVATLFAQAETDDSTIETIKTLRYNNKGLLFSRWMADVNAENLDGNTESSIVQLIKNGVIDRETAVRYMKLKQDGHHVGSIQWYIIESMLVSHIISCFGTKLAQVTVKWFQKPLFGTAFKLFDYTTEKILSLGQALNILSEEDRDDLSSLKSDFEGMFDEIPQMINQLISACSSNAQGPDMLAAMQGGDVGTMMISMMLKQQFLRILPTDTPEIAQKKTVTCIIRILTQFGVLSYSDGYSLMKTYDAKMRLAPIIASMKNAEISEEFIVDFTGKLGKFSIVLAKDFSKMVNSKEFAPKIALLRISRRLDVEFAKALADKIKIGIFAGVLSKTVFVPLLNQTIGNQIRDKGTLTDGAYWVGGKAIEGRDWLGRKIASAIM
ncbi:MAG: hypothetical protein US49_C0010G0012 [candidate division TM6 bacterium GW2011_GWF2_37_49]|nr:MAG: hypothetical protein US49_C0010G0012 [candidate division TM6 bacterium GW2011_GWF2_37_49]